MRKLAVALVLVFSLQGCAALGYINEMFTPPGVVEMTPRTEFALADAAYNTAVKAITKLGEMDVLSIVQLEAVEPVMVLVDQILHTWEKQLIEAKLLRDLGLDNAAIIQENFAAGNASLVSEGIQTLHNVIRAADAPLIGG